MSKPSSGVADKIKNFGGGVIRPQDTAIKEYSQRIKGVGGVKVVEKEPVLEKQSVVDETPVKETTKPSVTPKVSQEAKVWASGLAIRLQHVLRNKQTTPEVKEKIVKLAKALRSSMEESYTKRKEPFEQAVSNLEKLPDLTTPTTEPKTPPKKPEPQVQPKQPIPQESSKKPEPQVQTKQPEPKISPKTTEPKTVPKYDPSQFNIEWDVVGLTLKTLSTLNFSLYEEFFKEVNGIGSSKADIGVRIEQLLSVKKRINEAIVTGEKDKAELVKAREEVTQEIAKVKPFFPAQVKVLELRRDAVERGGDPLLTRRDQMKSLTEEIRNKISDGEKGQKELLVAKSEALKSLVTIKDLVPSEYKTRQPEVETKIEAGTDDILAKCNLMVVQRDELADYATRAVESNKEFLEALEATSKNLQQLKPPNPALQKERDNLAKNTSLDIFAKLTEARKLLPKARSLRVKQEIEGMPGEEVSTLATDRQIDLLESLKGYTGGTSEKTELLKKLYEKMPLDKSFLERDKVDRKANLLAVKKNPILLKAKENWSKSGGTSPDDVDVKAKIAALNEAVKIQCKQFGIDPPVPIVARLPNEKEKQSANTNPSRKITLQGQYSPSKNQIEILLHDNGTLRDFNDAVDTVMHEMTHGYQKWLADRVDAAEKPRKEGEKPKPGEVTPLPKDDPRYNQAKLFQLNNSMYLNSEEGGHKVYESQPVERHAWLAGTEASLTFKWEVEFKEIVANVAVYDTTFTQKAKSEGEKLQKIASTDPVALADAFEKVKKSFETERQKYEERWSELVKEYRTLATTGSETIDKINGSVPQQKVSDFGSQFSTALQVSNNLNTSRHEMKGTSIKALSEFVEKRKLANEQLATLEKEIPLLTQVVQLFEQTRQIANGVLKLANERNPKGLSEPAFTKFNTLVGTLNSNKSVGANLNAIKAQVVAIKRDHEALTQVI